MTSAIVIGGGIAGCSSAFALAKRGSKVTLIERHEKLALEASGNPIAMLYPKLSTKPSIQSSLALQGFEFSLNLLQNLPISHQFFEACGQIQLAFNVREQANQAALSSSSKWKLLNAIEASETAGIALKMGCLYLPQAGWVKPAALCEALCSSALINIKTVTHALKIEKIAHHWHVFDAQNNTLKADNMVICNANDIKQFQQCSSIEITSVRGQVNFFAVNELSKNVRTIICSDHSLSPAVDGTHSIGTSYAPNDKNSEISDADTRENLDALRAIAPEIYLNIDQNYVQGRVAWRSATPDYIPLAGQLLDDEQLCAKPPRYNANPADLPWLQGLYVNAGHGSKGMITAPICGELIACLICNSALPTDTKLASRLNPSRFLLRELGLKQLANSLY